MSIVLFAIVLYFIMSRGLAMMNLTMDMATTLQDQPQNGNPGRNVVQIQLASPQNPL